MLVQFLLSFRTDCLAQGLDYSAALELATLGRKAKECGRRSRRGCCGGWFRVCQVFLFHKRDVFFAYGRCKKV